MDIDLPAVRRAGAFWLVQSAAPPPRIPGFVPVSVALLRDCLGEPLRLMDLGAGTKPQGPGRRPVHEWSLTRYAVAAAGASAGAARGSAASAP